MSLKYQILAIGLTAFILVFLQPVYVQAFSCPDDPTNTKYYTKGLASTPNLGSNLKKTADSRCIVDPKAAFAPYKIPSYEDLKSLYYTQSKNSKGLSFSSLSSSYNFEIGDKVYLTSGDLSVSGTPTGSGTQVIFVEGNLSFTTANYTYGTSTTGTVFVVKDNVNIDLLVTRIDGIIISQGVICTAYTGSACLSATDTATSPQLTINGSLISINSNGSPAIKFRRRLADNSDPAEKIIHQPKYLVILRNLMSDTLQKWSEVQ